MLSDVIGEARRQTEICNACRYCEGYCSVFPAIHRDRAFSDGNMMQLANLCHNCQNCYHACQFTAPHEFDINLPKALAETRQESWEATAFPKGLGTVFHRHGTLICLAATVAIALLFMTAQNLKGSGDGFYAVMSHGIMVAIFLPAFVLPLICIAISLRRYWCQVGGGSITLSDMVNAFGSAAKMKNLAGGHGDGCNYEDEDRYSHSRRIWHQFVMYGFLLCFAATSVATVLHYVFDMPAPYPLFSLPKLFGLSGGILLSVGTLAMLELKTRGVPSLSDQRVRSGEFGFIFLLFFVSTSGLLLYAFGSTPALEVLLALHLGSVLTLFLLTPYTKMAHGFYRLTALIKDAQIRRLGDVK